MLRREGILFSRYRKNLDAWEPLMRFTSSGRPVVWLIRAVLACCLAVTALLAVSAPLVTGVFPRVVAGQINMDFMDLHSIVDGGLFSTFFIPMLFSLATLTVCHLLMRALRGAGARRLALAVFIAVAVLSALWALSLKTDAFLYPDTEKADVYARALLSGDYGRFSQAMGDGGLPYIRVYPFQSGYIFLMAGVYALFGAGNQVALQILNALCAGVTAASLVLVSHRLFGNRAARAAAVLTALCLPLALSSAFVYGNVPGLALASVSIALNVEALVSDGPGEAMRRRRLALLAGSMAALALTLMVKSTFAIILIAYAIIWIAFSVSRRDRRLLAAVLVLLLVVNRLSGLPTLLLEGIVGQDFGSGMPRASWIAIGLQWNPYLNKPGWWFPDVALHYAEVGGDAAAQGAYAAGAIRDALTGFARDPLYAVQFFVVKVATEWLDPTFQTLFYASQISTQAAARTADQLIYNGFDWNRIAVEFMDGYQSVLYVLAALGARHALRAAARDAGVGRAESGRAFAAALLALCFLGGFACFLIWEAKSTYVFPFAVLLIPFASAGMAAASVWMDRRRDALLQG